jgi:hypothetical protein
LSTQSRQRSLLFKLIGMPATVKVAQRVERPTKSGAEVRTCVPFLIVAHRAHSKEHTA